MDNHDDYVDSERAMRQGQMQNPYMMAGSMGMPGQFNGYGGMGNIAGMAPGQMPGAMGWQGGRQDQGAFRQQVGPPGSRAGAAAQVCVCVCVEKERGGGVCEGRYSHNNPWVSAHAASLPPARHGAAALFVR